MQMMYLLSWSRLRERGVVTRLESFDVVVTMDPRDAESLFDEINGLLKADEELLDALTAIDEDCILHYRHAQTRSGSFSPYLQMCFYDILLESPRTHDTGRWHAQPIIVISHDVHRHAWSQSSHQVLTALPCLIMVSRDMDI